MNCINHIFFVGPPQRDENGNIINDEFMGLPIVQQYSKRIWKQMITYNKVSIEYSFIQVNWVMGNFKNY